MKVYCPRGSKCSGSTAYVIQECFLQRTRKNVPSFILKKMRREGGLLLGLGAALLTTWGDQDKKTTYEVYECPSCEAQVVFMKYDNPGQGPVCERLGDNL